MNRDRALIARRTAKMDVVRADPAYRKRHAEACRQAKQRTMENPAAMERMREAGRTVGAKNFAAANTPESRAKAAAAIRARHLAWCPERYWPLNAQLKRACVRLDERKRMIAEQISADERARLAAMTPLERQLERLRNGARLVEVRPLRAAEPEFTLGGVSSGLLA